MTRAITMNATHYPTNRSAAAESAPLQPNAWHPRQGDLRVPAPRSTSSRRLAGGPELSSGLVAQGIHGCQIRGDGRRANWPARGQHLQGFLLERGGVTGDVFADCWREHEEAAVDHWHRPRVFLEIENCAVLMNQRTKALGGLHGREGGRGMLG